MFGITEVATIVGLIATIIAVIGTVVSVSTNISNAITRLDTTIKSLQEVLTEFKERTTSDVNMLNGRIDDCEDEIKVVGTRVNEVEKNVEVLLRK